MPIPYPSQQILDDSMADYEYNLSLNDGDFILLPRLYDIDNQPLFLRQSKGSSDWIGSGRHFHDLDGIAEEINRTGELKIQRHDVDEVIIKAKTPARKGFGMHQEMPELAWYQINTPSIMRGTSITLKLIGYPAYSMGVINHRLFPITKGGGFGGLEGEFSFVESSHRRGHKQNFKVRLWGHKKEWEEESDMYRRKGEFNKLSSVWQDKLLAFNGHIINIHHLFDNVQERINNSQNVWSGIKWSEGYKPLLFKRIRLSGKNVKKREKLFGLSSYAFTSDSEEYKKANANPTKNANERRNVDLGSKVWAADANQPPQTLSRRPTSEAKQEYHRQRQLKHPNVMFAVGGKPIYSPNGEEVYAWLSDSPSTFVEFKPYDTKTKLVNQRPKRTKQQRARHMTLDMLNWYLIHDYIVPYDKAYDENEMAQINERIEKLKSRPYHYGFPLYTQLEWDVKGLRYISP